MAAVQSWTRQLLAHNGVALAVVALALFWGAENAGSWFNHPITGAVMSLIPLALIIAYWSSLFPKPKGPERIDPTPQKPATAGLTVPASLKLSGLAVALAALLPFLRYFQFQDDWPVNIASSLTYGLFAAFILTAFILLVANYRPGPAFLPKQAPPLLAAAIVLAVGCCFPITDWYHPCYATFIGCLAAAAAMAQRAQRPELRPNS